MQYSRDAHPPDDELLLAGDRELPSTRQAMVDAHLAACPVCAGRVQHMQALLQEASMLRESDVAARSSRAAARTRLERSLRELSRTWERGWTSRLRRVLAASHTWGMLTFAAPLLFVVIWVSRPDTRSAGVPLARAPQDLLLPLSALTPGAVAPLTAGELCRGARPSRRVSLATQRQVLTSYRMQHVASERYELDALITPELGGTTAAENLWPQMYDSPIWNARVKDELERLLPELVCRGGIELARAQHQIATDWIAAYKAHFKTNEPLRAHIGPPLAEEDELEFETPYVFARSAVLLLSAAPARAVR